MHSKKAFTLIELLVVIAIIGILATISIISLSNARAKSRDAKRAGDIKQIQTALEMFFNDKGRYPTVEEWSTNKIFSTTSMATLTYMQIIPTAPTPADGGCSNNQNSLVYTPNVNGGSYSVSFCLGNTTGALTDGPKCLTPGGILDVSCGLNFNCGTESVTYGGEVYPTVLIGSKCWMTKNLNIGTRIDACFSGMECPSGDPQNQSNNSIIEKYCYLDDKNSSECDSYGGLYQLGEVMQYSVVEGAQGICPDGWHVPSYSEWTSIQRSGLSELNIVPFGYLDDSGTFCNGSPDADTWLSSMGGPNSWDLALSMDNPVSDHFHYEQTSSFSVRCVMN